MKILALFLFYQSMVFADVPTNQLNEIEYLLNYIKNTQCVINRNGSEHVGEQAVKHIEKKYNYYRDDIKNTEDFIQFSATKSLMSGNYYTVKCPAETKITTQEWLLSELKRYRNKKIVAGKKELTMCSDPRPQICTREYRPVCAELKDGRLKTYATGCTACSDVNVASYRPAECSN